MSKQTKRVQVGGVPVGGGAPVSIQSMTNTDTRDVPATLAQIRALAQAGCEIVRIAVFDPESAEAVSALVDGSPVPLVADIHFDVRLAVAALERGIDKLRINPGNIGGPAKVKILLDALRARPVPVRVGVNSGSVERDLLQKYGGPTPEAMVESALSHARLLEEGGFSDIVLSLKASNVPDTVRTYRLASERCAYPLHLGVTEAGLPGLGNVKSAIGIGALLVDGIGDTVRVSLTGDPLLEPAAALDILRAVGLRKEGVSMICCPTCGRTRIAVEEIARRVEEGLSDVTEPVKVAVMGCVVNGPGEAREADLGIAGGDDNGALFVKGQAPRKVEGDLAQILIDATRRWLREKEG